MPINHPGPFRPRGTAAHRVVENTLTIRTDVPPQLQQRGRLGIAADVQPIRFHFLDLPPSDVARARNTRAQTIPLPAFFHVYAGDFFWDFKFAPVEVYLSTARAGD